MRDFKYIWVVGLIVTTLIIIVPIVLVTLPESEAKADPWEPIPERNNHTDHTNLFDGPFETGYEVTLACLECHEDAATQVMADGWDIFEGSIIAIEQNTITIRASTGEDVQAQVGPPGFLVDGGLHVQVGDYVSVPGFYRGEVFYAAEIVQQAASLRVLVFESGSGFSLNGLSGGRSYRDMRDSVIQFDGWSFLELPGASSL